MFIPNEIKNMIGDPLLIAQNPPIIDNTINITNTAIDILKLALIALSAITL